MKKIFPSINGIRAISISMVVIHHLIIRQIVPDTRYIQYFNTFINGGFGVNIFFVISGFLITTILINEEIENNNISLRNFYTRRVLRIFPAYYFLLLIYFLLQLVGLIYIPVYSWLTALTFTKQFNNSYGWPDHHWLTGHLWSISVEEVFYLFWPFAFIKFKNNRNALSIAIIFIVMILRIILGKFPVSGFDGFTIFQRADALMIGGLFALNYNRILNINNPRFSNLRLIICAIALVVSLAVGNWYTIKHFSLFTVTLFGSYGTISSLLVAYILILSINIKNLWYRFLNTNIMNHIGKLSYSIYLWQQIFTDGKLKFLQFSAPVLILFIFIAAYISYYFIEKPFLRLKSKFN